ncbi:MAG: RidA family protein [Pseudomonadales bacterium]|nr:RidA family protein [Pseudomonadales bacterium]
MLKILSAIAFLVVAVTGVKVAADENRLIEFLNSKKVVTADLPFSEAVRVGNLLFLSGQIGVIPGTLNLIPGGIQAEAKQTLENIKTSLQAHGYEMNDLVKCTVMLADMSDWPIFNEVYKGFFTPPYPARSAFATNGLAIGARVEIECVAAVVDKKN